MRDARSVPHFLIDDKGWKDFLPLWERRMLAAGETGAPSLFFFSFFFFFKTNLVFLACISALANTCVVWESWRSGAGRRQMMGMSLKGTGLNPPPRPSGGGPGEGLGGGLGGCLCGM